MGKSLKAAVIGTGVISKQHLSFLDSSDSSELVGVCDLSTAAAQYAAEKFHAHHAFTNYQTMLAETKPDVVHILTPPNTHQKLVTDCLNANAHVICEKPITPAYQDFKALWELAQEKRLHLVENHNYRFNEGILKIEEMVQNGTLGDVQEVEVRVALGYREEGGRFADRNLPNPVHNLPAGVVHDVITHMCYLLLRFMPEVERVAAAWSNHGGGDLFKYDDLDALLLNGQQHARLRFSCYTKPECFTLFVRGSRGYAETDLFQPYLRTVIPRAGGEQLSPLVNHFVNGWDLMGSSFKNFRNKVMQRTAYEGLHRLLDQTYTAILNHQPMPVSFDDMDKTNRLIETLLAEENRV
ncbi:MAG TPA: Gfo/Idh/MocA family oxidoreductase [Nodosilinea sp.]|nr:Gfo/Idh/MocA family oxidoreductase [Nodosilinea sp.]